jgi:hypothetical protein
MNTIESREEHKEIMSIKEKIYRELNKDKMHEYQLKYRDNPLNTERIRIKCKIYHTTNKERIHKHRAEYYATHREKYKIWHKEWRDKNKATRLIKNREKTKVLKLKTLTYYGNGTCACVKCGFDNIDALSIDHVNGGGGQHRKNITSVFYQWLKQQNYPDGYQTLCMNCQWIKRKQEIDQSRLSGQYSLSNQQRWIKIGKDCVTDWVI